MIESYAKEFDRRTSVFKTLVRLGVVAIHEFAAANAIYYPESIEAAIREEGQRLNLPDELVERYAAQAAQLALNDGSRRCQ